MTQMVPQDRPNFETAQLACKNRKKTIAGKMSKNFQYSLKSNAVAEGFQSDAMSTVVGKVRTSPL